MPFQEEDKNQAYKESNILYDSDSLMLVEPDTYTAAKYFGPKYVSDRYSSTFRDGDLYFIIQKDSSINPLPTSTIFKPRNGGKTVLLDNDMFDIKVKEMLDKFTEIKDILEPMIGFSDIYSALKRISEGEIINSHELNSLDNLIYSASYDKTNSSKCKIYLRFDDDEDYFKLFDVNEDDIWYFNQIYSRYESFEFEDMFYTEESWREGYLIREFNTENQSKVIELMKLLNPGITNLKTDENCRLASDTLSNTFSSEVDEIVYEWNLLTNECKLVQAKKEIKDSFCNRFEDSGIITQECYWKYLTSVNLLLRIYKKVGDKSLGLYDLLKSYAHQEFGGMSGWDESRYEVQCYQNNFDEEGFQKQVEISLERISDKLEDSDSFYDLEEYKKITDEVVSKYGIGQTHKLPKNPEKSFSIESIDPKTNKILVIYNNYKGLTGSKQKRSLSLEEFYNFLYHPELFENVKKR